MPSAKDMQTIEAPQPLWILSAPFSGLSWATATLGRHPDLFATPELDLLLADSVGDLLDIFAISQGTQGHGLLRLLAWLEFQRQDDVGIQLAQSWLEERRDWSSTRLLQSLREAVYPRRLVVPERDATLRPMALLRLQRALPELRVLHLTRHPWEQGVLLHAWAMEHLYVSIDFRDFAQNPPQIDPQLPWLRANENIEHFCERLHHSQYQRLRAEQLEGDSDASLRALCEWLDLPADAAALAAMQQPQLWRFSQPGPDLASGGLEAEAHQPWSSQTLQRAAQPQFENLPWRADGAGFAPQVLACAERYGYRPPDEASKDG